MYFWGLFFCGGPEAEEGGSAAGHGGVGGSLVVESLLDGGEFRMRREDRRFEVVDEALAPFRHRPGEGFAQGYRGLGGCSLREAAVALGFLTGEEYDAFVQPENMI